MSRAYPGEAGGRGDTAAEWNARARLGDAAATTDRPSTDLGPTTDLKPAGASGGPELLPADPINTDPGSQATAPRRGPSSGESTAEVTPDREALTIEVAPGWPPRKMAAGGPDIPGYEILGVLGRGGMGIVYKARQTGLDRLVALKMILAGGDARPGDLERFYAEARAVAQFQHPNIVQVHEVGQRDDLPYFSLEFVAGGSLAQKVAGHPHPIREAAGLAETLARAIHLAHQRGIVHRDLKPANVLLTSDGAPKITDFGLAKRLVEEDSGQTREGSVLGTPSYMAPEQARGATRDVGPAADQYALGAILYELLTGRPPFQGKTVHDTLEQVRSQEPEPPGRFRSEVPRDLETICLKCLQKEPHRRYADAFELAEDLRRFLEGRPIMARPSGRAERLWRWCKRNPKVAALTAAVFGLLVAGVVVSTGSAVAIARERNHKERQRALADQARRDAEEARRIADVQVALALDTIKTLIHKVQGQLEAVPRAQEVKKDLLQTAEVGLKQVARSAHGQSSTEVAVALSAVQIRLGLIYRQIGETEKAFEHVRESHRMNQEQLAAHPDSDRARRNLASSFTVLAETNLELRHDLKACLENYRQALALREQLYNDPHPDPDVLPRKEIAQGLADIYFRVGVTLLRMGDPAAARDAFMKALALREDLAKQYPGEHEVQQDLARAYHAVGEMNFRLHDPEAGLRYFGKCLALRERLFRAEPNDPGLTENACARS
jgi:eukaryotic-like serine/threonine-protein kinase